MKLIKLLTILLVFTITQPITLLHAETVAERSARTKDKCLAQKGNFFDIEEGFCIIGVTTKMQKECTAKGGKWHVRHMAFIPTCIFKYKDAGKICTSGSDCEGGECSDKGKHLNKNGIFYGECVTDNDPYSRCYDNLIEKGQKQVRPCADE